ncbi:hypothetical protein Cgig2_006772 [Carnegiea gigantea]|uniref:Uncharacterized protein n=1 Tax=Carnegiea gigantea TaxID=171969 RepID=A0A9Q1JS35_9CARY|nr:hypothetical protein Cgig2_006772 [Carnegiea gigantea]
MQEKGSALPRLLYRLPMGPENIVQNVHYLGIPVTSTPVITNKQDCNKQHGLNGTERNTLPGIRNDVLQFRTFNKLKSDAKSYPLTRAIWLLNQGNPYAPLHNYSLSQPPGTIKRLIQGHLGAWLKYALILPRLAKEVHIVTNHSWLHNHQGK